MSVMGNYQSFKLNIPPLKDTGSSIANFKDAFRQKFETDTECFNKFVDTLQEVGGCIPIKILINKESVEEFKTFVEGFWSEYDIEATLDEEEKSEVVNDDYHLITEQCGVFVYLVKGETKVRFRRDKIEKVVDDKKIDSELPEKIIGTVTRYDGTEDRVILNLGRKEKINPLIRIRIEDLPNSLEVFVRMADLEIKKDVIVD